MRGCNPQFSELETERYRRQLDLPGFGAVGQQRLRETSVLVVGAGGLGTPVSLYLAAAGVGRIGVVDFDTVDRSNLHRQVLYTEHEIGEAKTSVLAARLRQVNPYIEITEHAVRLTAENALDVIAGYDIVADGTDRFETRYLVNDACVIAGVPNVYASVDRFEGQLSIFAAPGGPCYRCVFPEPPPPGLVPSCADGGVLGVVPGIMGTLQATEVIKLASGVGSSMTGRLLLMGALDMSFRTIQIDRDPACTICGDSPTLHSIVPIPPAACIMPVPEITVQDLHRMTAEGDRPFLVDVRQPEEHAIGHIDGALIPLGDLPDRLDELEPHREDEQIIVHCRSGGRSGQAVEYLQSQGFTNVVNLKGGILAWNAEIDPSVSTDMPG